MPGEEILVALLREKKDYAILRKQGWYRIPVQHAPKRWPPDYLAFYQPGAFGKQAFEIRLYGKVDGIARVRRRELFPNEPENATSDKEYFKLAVDALVERQNAIRSRFPRRVVFVSTTMAKFLRAEELNDLYDESPLEDRLWEALKHAEIPAERQFDLPLKPKSYRLDFAVFCKQGYIDAETDGDSYHARRERIPEDNERNNALTAAGWRVLRFNSSQIAEEGAKYCVNRIKSTVNKLGGLTADGQVPRRFFPEDNAQQLSLF